MKIICVSHSSTPLCHGEGLLFHIHLNERNASEGIIFLLKLTCVLLGSQMCEIPQDNATNNASILFIQVYYYCVKLSLALLGTILFQHFMHASIATKKADFFRNGENIYYAIILTMILCYCNKHGLIALAHAVALYSKRHSSSFSIFSCVSVATKITASFYSEGQKK